MCLQYRSIKRVVFETVHKFKLGKLTTLSVSEIRQIAGRAGRYRTSQQAINATANDENNVEILEDADRSRLDVQKPVHVVSSEESNSTPALAPDAEDDMSHRAKFDNKTIGLVTTLDAADFDVVKQALNAEPPPLTFASIQPPPGIIQRFASYFPPDTPLSYILLRLSELSSTTHRYKIYHRAEDIMMADLIHGIEGLSMEDKMILINAPAGAKNPLTGTSKFVKELARCVGQQRVGEILKLENLDLDILDAPSEGSKTRLKALEELHKCLVLYLWLSFRFPGIFTQRPLCNHVKELVEKEIENTLSLMTFMSTKLRRQQLRKKSIKLEEMQKALREDQGIPADDTAEEVAEPGFELRSGDDVVAAEVDEAEAVVLPENGENMPEDDEGEYPEEAVEVSPVEEEGEPRASGTG